MLILKKRILFCFLISLFIFPILGFTESLPTSRHGGQLVLSTISDPKSFNDILAKETSTTLVTSLIFEGLTTVDAFTLKVKPLLAESWSVSDNGLEWVFQLRQDVSWFDGVPFTADDVVFTFNQLINNPDIPSSSKDIFTIEGQPLKVEKISDSKVRFILPVKFAPFLRSLSQSILPKHKLERFVLDGNFNFTWGIDTDPQEIVGTGPFKLVEYAPGQRMVFDKNPLYWKKSQVGEQLPYIDRIIYLIVQNVDVSLLKFIEGVTDSYSLRGMDYPLLKPLEKEKGFAVYDLGPDTGSNFIAFNLNPGVNPKSEQPFVDPKKSAWFKDIDFRMAVAHAIDKKQIIQIVKNGLGYPQHSPVGPAAGFFHNPDVQKYEYDLLKAKNILASAGYKDRDNNGILEDAQGNPIEFNMYTNSNNTERIDIAAIIRHDLESLGMKINFQALEFNSLVSKLTSSFEWDTIVMGLTGGTEPHFGKNVWTSAGQLHLWQPRQESPVSAWEKRIDEIFTQGVQELDEDKRKVYYDEFQEIIAQQLPLVYTVLSSKLSAVRDKFGNLNPSNYGGVFHNLEEIYVREEYR